MFQRKNDEADTLKEAKWREMTSSLQSRSPVSDPVPETQLHCWPCICQVSQSTLIKFPVFFFFPRSCLNSASLTWNQKNPNFKSGSHCTQNEIQSLFHGLSTHLILSSFPTPSLSTLLLTFYGRTDHLCFPQSQSLFLLWSLYTVFFSLHFIQNSLLPIIHLADSFR